MTTNAAVKKPAPKEDWHTADIIAAVHKAGWSLQQLAFENGYQARTALTGALRRRYPRAEKIIADVLDKKPGEIWPTRYCADLTTPNSQAGAAPRRPGNQPPQGKATTGPQAGHSQSGKE
ncbi:helix-turn-helix domain-containing protein [Luteibacter aegosomatis]|uniref:helix-turn-helix domain-containing protein n=1 Tax=Luteibacter aegosomatis TaxID=2911537 RepID=UPI001FFB1CA7|nr:helix-turn-helix domain-containing protein [Luteibacter aegosomatis]UPG86995.1 helix-turn-helix domain-containing protein [Luteibacter aegosomatis]